jgi:outer membrane protein insertion porin family
MTHHRNRPVLILVLLLFLLAVQADLHAEPGTVESINIQGLFRMSREAFLHALGVQEGDPYDEALLRRRFRELWELRLFEDLTMEAELAPDGGMALIIKIEERPVLTSVTYEDNKVATRTQIEDRLKERSHELKLGQPLDRGEVFFAESDIRALIEEKGYLDANVEAQIRHVTETTRAVFFEITPGGKTRISKIDFVGNEIFKDKKLRGQLQLTQQRKWYWPWSQKNLYHPLKWDQDVSNIRDLYQNNGYLDVQIRPPVVEVKEDKSEKKKQEEQAGDSDEPEEEAPTEAAEMASTEPIDPKKAEKEAKKAAKKKRKQEKKAGKKSLVFLTVAVEEGPQYTLGEVRFTGNERFPAEILRRGVRLKEGAVFKNDAIEAGVEAMSRLYEDQGYLYVNVIRRIERQEGNVADVEVVIDEDEPYYISRVEFAGNTQTQDRVLRRELLSIEGDLFSRTKLDVSQRKVNQLGYFQVPEQAVIEPVENENRVRVTVPGEEQGRNEIQIGGGYSGLDGAFFNGVYSTRNFLGRGQVLSVALQVGGRTNRYQISFQEPWFMNKPILLGFNIFSRDVDYGSTLNSQSRGFGVIAGKRVGRFARFNLGYNWEKVESRTLLTTASVDNAGLSSVTSTTQVSSLTPVYTYTTINNPYRPTGGREINASMQIAGGPLGGDTSYLKPVVRLTNYKGLWSNRYIATHAELGYITEWAGGSTRVASNINEVPRFQRFWLGGETLGPRIFETRTITPRRYVGIDAGGQIVEVLGDPRFVSVEDLVTSGGQPVLVEVGGNRYWLLQNEIVLPLNEQAEIALFLDAGDSLFEDQSINFDTTRVSAGIELRFHLPIFPVPLRLIYGTVVREQPGDRSSSFTFSIGRSF